MNDKHLTREEVASRISVIPQEYKEIAQVIFKKLGEKRVVEILRGTDPRLAKLEVKQLFNLSLFAVNVAFDFLGLARAHQYAKPARASAKPPGGKAFVTERNIHVMRRGACVTVNGKGARIVETPKRVRVNERGGWVYKFEYRLFGDDPAAVKVATIEDDSVIYLR